MIPNITDEKSALIYASECSKGERDLCEELSQGDDLFKVVVDRWDSLKRLPLIVAVKRDDHIYFDGPSHGSIVKKHPELTFVEADNLQFSIPGFLHDDGRFLTREQAANVGLYLTGILLNERQMLSGEEWIPKIETKDDAEELGLNMHFRGYNIAKQRINIFRSLKKHEQHIKFLTIAIDLFEKFRF